MVQGGTEPVLTAPPTFFTVSIGLFGQTSHNRNNYTIEIMTFLYTIVYEQI